MKSLLLGLTLLVTSQTFAADIISSPYQLISPCYEGRSFGGYSQAFCVTLHLTDELFGNRMERVSPLKILAFTVALPFTILDEDNKSLGTNVDSLIEQGYGHSEIEEYVKDLQKIEKELQVRKVENKSDGMDVITELKENGSLSSITIEIMGL